MSLLTPTPAQRALKKVLTISLLNGWSVALFAGLCSLVSLAFGELLGFGVGLLVVASGVMEIHGHRRLKRHQADGLTWLVRSQLFLLSVLLVYAVSRLFSLDGETVLSNLTPEMETVLSEAGITRADIVQMVQLFFRAFYSAIILATLLYQGGLAFFYRRKSPLVIEALTVPGV
ncbi:MAG: hypothetical protein Q8J74_11680 [Candidatus Didemnitutus sp.]|nr:hypothetical protein [Candidatus Didemnitutus sp.]